MSMEAGGGVRGGAPPERKGSLEDVAGLVVGHWTDLDAITGVTVVVAPPGTIGSGEIRGCAPATRETDILAPHATVTTVDAVCLSGGSAFGLGAAQGVVEWLAEQGRGHPTRYRPVPIVPAASIYDLNLGSPDAYPRPEHARAAIEAGNGGAEGTVGAGTGTSVGKRGGNDWATKGGVGQASLRWEVEPAAYVTVAALAVVNTLGDVLAEDGSVLAGCRHPEAGYWEVPATAENTALIVVATDARLDKIQAFLIAQRAQDALAATIRPPHTRYDGDSTFALATGEVDVTGPLSVDRIAEEAGRVAAQAVRQAVRTASPVGGVPSMFG